MSLTGVRKKRRVDSPPPPRGWTEEWDRFLGAILDDYRARGAGPFRLEAIRRVVYLLMESGQRSPARINDASIPRFEAHVLATKPHSKETYRRRLTTDLRAGLNCALRLGLLTSLPKFPDGIDSRLGYEPR